eukprot:6491407-Amphidinium_carterae.7
MMAWQLSVVINSSAWLGELSTPGIGWCRPATRVVTEEFEADVAVMVGVEKWVVDVRWDLWWWSWDMLVVDNRVLIAWSGEIGVRVCLQCDCRLFTVGGERWRSVVL